MTQISPIALRARVVFPVASPPTDGGCVTILGGRIVAVGRTADCTIQDLGDMAILPGLINAHTHLEFSHLNQPLGNPGMALPDWIRFVVAARRAAPSDRGAIERGLQESLSAGTTALGEIATNDWRQDAAGEPKRSPTVTMFHEAIGPTAERAQIALAAAHEFYLRQSPDANVRPGLSPHAPYTVHAQLLEGLIGLARAHNLPLAMHLAESREELELLATARGPFRQLLEDVGAFDSSPAARHAAILDYLQRLAEAPRALAIHGNYLSTVEMAFLAENRERMSLVYCPRTHAFFGHEAYPLAKLLSSGVRIALGTDSRASNPDLSLFEDFRFAAARHADVSPADLLRMATLNAAEALGIDSDHGSLAPGKLANLAIVAIPPGAFDDPHSLFMEPAAHVVQTWVGSRI